MQLQEARDNQDVRQFPDQDNSYFSTQHCCISSCRISSSYLRSEVSLPLHIPTWMLAFYIVPPLKIAHGVTGTVSSSIHCLKERMGELHALDFFERLSVVSSDREV